MSFNNFGQLRDSDRWISFLESTAKGLKLQLSIILPDKKVLLQTSTLCPDCQFNHSPISNSDIEMILAHPNSEIALENGLIGYTSPLKSGLFMLARECLCSAKIDSPLTSRSHIAAKLITSFQIALAEVIESGQRAVELSTLRQMNHIVLSLCQGDESALDNSFDLILSALIILLEAKGSYLEFKDADLPELLIKGEVEAIKAARLNPDNLELITVDVAYQSSPGKLGIFLPSDSKQALKLLPLMAQECTIALEINNLFRLLNKQLTQVLGAVASAVLLIDKRHSISFANRKAETLLGQSSMELIGCPMGNWSGPWLTYLKSETSTPVCGEMEPFKIKADQYWVDWQLSPILEGSTIMGWLLLLNDRTDYYHWQTAARQAERFAITATMLGSMAHELRNPIGAAKGLLQLMGRKRDPEQTRNFTNLVLRELDRVTSLLNEFLLLGKPANIEIEPLDPVVFLQELLPLFQGEVVGTTAEVILDTKPVSPIAGDSGQLTQVMLNLVRNALQAVNYLGVVTITVKERDGFVGIDVSDTGPGLTPEAFNNLFRPFYTTKEGGTGLGLPIVQAIIHNHGGKITASNKSDGGAVFSINLPLAPKESNFFVDILLAVRDKFFTYPAEQALRSFGLKVITFENLKQAMQDARYYCPTLLVTDSPNDESTVQDLLSIQTCWPNTKILLLSSSIMQPNIAQLAATEEHSALLQPHNPLEYPVDLNRFISMTRRLLAYSS